MSNNISQKIIENENLIGYTINKFFPGRKNDEDIYQVGLIALWKAIEHEENADDNEKSANFTTYAIKCIKHQIIKEIEKENAQKRTLADGFTTLYLDSGNMTNDGNLEKYSEIIGNEEIPYLELGIKEYTSRQTERRKKIIELIGMGYSLTDIANILNISKTTVYNEWKILRKELKRLC